MNLKGRTALAAAVLLTPAPGLAQEQAEASFSSAVEAQAAAQHLQPGVAAMRNAFAWYVARPSLGGEARLVVLRRHRDRFYASRSRYRTSDVLAAAGRDFRAGIDPARTAAGLPVVREQADESWCPALAPALRELERLPAATIDVPGTGKRSSKAVSLVLDGTTVTLTFPFAGDHGEVSFSNNAGPVHAWAQRFERATSGCWRTDTRT